MNSWIEKLKSAKKASFVQNDRKKVHYTFEDQSEMVEEYDLKTNVLLVRKWRRKSSGIGLKTVENVEDWQFEVGQNLAPKGPLDQSGLIESNAAPTFSRNDKDDKFEFRIRNLPYSLETYQLSVDKDKHEIVLRTTNKKYFKRFSICDLDRCHLPIDESNLSFTHANNTLIINYKKPQEILQLEKQVKDELTKLNMKKEGDTDCGVS